MRHTLVAQQQGSSSLLQQRPASVTHRCYVPQSRQPAAPLAARSAADRRRLAAAVRAAAGRQQPGAPPVSITLPGNTTLAMPRAVITIGSGAEADVRLQGSNVAPLHAQLEYKGGRLFCTALKGDPDLLLAPTHCWIDGVELRPGVSYMVAPGALIAVGTQDSCLRCAFEEGGNSAMTEMLMKGLAASASKEVQEKLGGL